MDLRLFWPQVASQQQFHPQQEWHLVHLLALPGEEVEEMTEPMNWQAKGRTAAQRVLDYSIPEPNSGCWLWVGAVNACGYGTMRFNYHSHLAHRISYAALRGKFPKQKRILHLCDMPCCVNPEHLFVGTQADNVADMERKGRAYHPAAENHGRSKLTEQRVREIRLAERQYGSIAALARKYGVTKTAIRGVLNFRTWKNVA